MAIMLVAASVTGVTALAASPVAAADDDTLLGGVLEGPDDDESRTEWALGGASVAWSAAKGAQERSSWWFGGLNPFADEPPGAAEEAKALTTYYNGNNATLEAYANERTNWTADHTVEITILVEDSEATRYLVANASNGNLTDTTMVKTTSRTPDETLTACGYAAEQSQEELEYFIQEYAEPNKDVDTKYLARIKGKYNKDVETSLYPSGGDCEGGS